MSIDLIILSDSHGRAISDGARRLGLNVRDITFSGALWHSGRFRYRKGGLLLGAVGKAKQDMAALQKEINNTNIMRAGIPVLTTMGFHMGRLVPPFGWYNHTGDVDDFNSDKTSIFTSSDFISQYIDAYRAKHFRVAEQMSRVGNLIIVPSPVTFSRRNYRTFRCHIKDRLISSGVTLYDPMDDLSNNDGVLPEELIASDGTHANIDYGVKVVEGLRRRNLL